MAALADEGTAARCNPVLIGLRVSPAVRLFADDPQDDGLRGSQQPISFSDRRRVTPVLGVAQSDASLPDGGEHGIGIGQRALEHRGTVDPTNRLTLRPSWRPEVSGQWLLDDEVFASAGGRDRHRRM
jgi:hypothetical protein